jgi:hypothetical protein
MEKKSKKYLKSDFEFFKKDQSFSESSNFYQVFYFTKAQIYLHAF